MACGLRWPKKLDGYELLKVPAQDQVFDGHSIAFTGYEDDPIKPGGGAFTFRNSFGPQWGNKGYGVMSFAYAQAYANDALWLQLEPPNSEVPLVRFEAEALPIVLREKCETSSQDMREWGRTLWSQGKQLLGVAKKGGLVELAFHVDKPGVYRVRVLATAAPDFGKIRIAARWQRQSRRIRPLQRPRLPRRLAGTGHALHGGRHAPDSLYSKRQRSHVDRLFLRRGCD